MISDKKSSFFQHCLIDKEAKLGCPKCKLGVFERSSDVDIYYICDNCGHTMWNGLPTFKKYVKRLKAIQTKEKQ
jgi:ribosomal protein L37AE/L43A